MVPVCSYALPGLCSEPTSPHMLSDPCLTCVLQTDEGTAVEAESAEPSAMFGGASVSADNGPVVEQPGRRRAARSSAQGVQQLVQVG